jgi:cation diffusion facilitator CzcD-associated flavoprotein CzcO
MEAMSAHTPGPWTANKPVPDQHELLAKFTEWARQVAAREDVPMRIRSAAATLHDDGKRLLAKAAGGAA